jgi:hypothetical protein
MDRDRLPDHERAEQREKRCARGRRERRPCDPADRDEQKRRGADPEQPPVARAVAEEKSAGDERGSGKRPG